MHLSGGGTTPWLQPKSNVTFKLDSPQLVKTLSADFEFNFFNIVVNVPTGLQTCAKMLQMHLLGSGGTLWLQPKNNGTFKLTSLYVFKFLATDCGFKDFIIVATVPTGLQTCEKVLQMNFSGSRGTPWLQLKSNITF